MARGFFKGVALGGCVGLGAAAALSVAVSLQTSPITEPTGSADGVADTAPAPARIADTGASGGAAPAAPSPEPDTIAGLLPDILAPAAVPQASALTDLQGAQLSQTDDPAEPSLRPALTGNRAAPAPSVAVEGDAALGGGPDQPMAPIAVPQETAFGAPQAVQSEKASETAQQGLASTPELATEPPVTQDETTERTTSFASDPVQPPAPIASETVAFPPVQGPVTPDPATPGVEGRSALAQSASVADDKTETGSEGKTADAEEVAPEVAEAPQQPDLFEVAIDAPSSLAPETSPPEVTDVAALFTPQKGQQKTALGESASARVTARVSVDAPRSETTFERPADVTGKIDQLPEPVSPGPLPPVTVQDAKVAALVAEPVPDAARLRPIDRFAQPFENPQGKPLMAIVLMDEGLDVGRTEAALASLRRLPYPVSLAVDVVLPDAAERMRIYRRAGFEVLATVDLPEVVTPGDVADTVTLALEALPEVVGVLESPRRGIQLAPFAGAEILRLLAQTGHGIVTQNGTTSVQSLADQSAVPSAIVFRDFDSRGQSTTAIGRFLDQAAFKAGQEGSVIMLGRLREETIAALMHWVAQDRAATVAMSPVSAALLSR